MRKKLCDCHGNIGGGGLPSLLSSVTIGLLLYYSLFCTLVATLQLGADSLLDGKLGYMMHELTTAWYCTISLLPK